MQEGESPVNIQHHDPTFDVQEKEASELATLCNVNLPIMVYGEGGAQPRVWPSNEEEAKQFLIKFKEMPEVGGFMKTTNQETFLDSHGPKLHEQVCKLQDENHKGGTLILLHDSMDGSRPSLVGTCANELVRLRNVVEMKMKMNKATSLVHNLVGKQGSLLEQPLVPPPVSSSSRTWAASHTQAEKQWMMAPLEQHPHLQQDWQVADLTPTDGELTAMISSVFAGSSSNPSTNGCDMMQPYNLGPYSGLP